MEYKFKTKVDFAKALKAKYPAYQKFGDIELADKVLATEKGKVYNQHIQEVAEAKDTTEEDTGFSKEFWANFQKPTGNEPQLVQGTDVAPQGQRGVDWGTSTGEYEQLPENEDWMQYITPERPVYWLNPAQKESRENLRRGLTLPGTAIAAGLESGLSQIPSSVPLVGRPEGTEPISFGESFRNDPSIQRGTFGELGQTILRSEELPLAIATAGLGSTVLKSSVLGAPKIPASAALGEPAIVSKVLGATKLPDITSKVIGAAKSPVTSRVLGPALEGLGVTVGGNVVRGEETTPQDIIFGAGTGAVFGGLGELKLGNIAKKLKVSKEDVIKAGLDKTTTSGIKRVAKSEVKSYNKQIKDEVLPYMEKISKLDDDLATAVERNKEAINSWISEINVLPPEAITSTQTNAIKSAYNKFISTLDEYKGRALNNNQTEINTDIVKKAWADFIEESNIGQFIPAIKETGEFGGTQLYKAIEQVKEVVPEDIRSLGNLMQSYKGLTSIPSKELIPLYNKAANITGTPMMDGLFGTPMNLMKRGAISGGSLLNKSRIGVPLINEIRDNQSIQDATSNVRNYGNNAWDIIRR